ncbi:related to NADH-ubiquinone oxidoreductase B18 subunit [Moesziomyces antarcticus]|uniref:NADH dehydrogenase [ubiquinone] 1 beta subcomplex subunit 7 n=1 Tax=Pseudozyma antarctica TaxID=84753 RepID=A0A5C3FZB0_PSEA2|nr:related to NADH-ubiquinone oxidoreductase B18 subunit [Moesziomyces antarcticus]
MADTHTASVDEANAARLPLGYRDQCSALLIPLNKCRKQTLYAPWKCEDERHTYEKCQYDEQRELSQLKKAKAEADE